MKYGAIFVGMATIIIIIGQVLLVWLMYGLGCKLTPIDIGITTGISIVIGSITGIATANTTREMDEKKKKTQDQSISKGS